MPVSTSFYHLKLHFPPQVVLYDVDAGQVILKKTFPPHLRVVINSIISFQKVERALSNIKEELVEFENAGTLR